MSASSIPNLLSLRGSRGGRGRTRGGRAGPGGPGPDAAAAHNATIQATDTDAAVSRLSAVELGYLDDPFARLFVQQPPGPSSRRLPIINRGTYTRTTAIENIVSHFLQTTQGQKRQIISLGAGTDTRALRLFASTSPVITDLAYHELDFPATVAQKLTTIRSSPQLQSILTITPNLSPPPPPPSPNSSQTTTTYQTTSTTNPTNTLTLHGIDLRSLTATSPPLPSITSTLPTLLISECCLCYLSPQEAASVLSHFTTLIPAAGLGIILYEPIKPQDPFGRMMVSNLAARQIRMPTLEVYKQPEDQAARLRDAGFEFVETLTVDAAWERWVDAEEKERVDALEGLDEVEEWVLLAGHYIVAWAWKGGKFELPGT
ncbi:putative leucine carboxyl methyltransferase [Echria macrotheca]|uniref:Leucine carboxyl methyltransferase 1 n=1 Tax=Echria macrotheca TaxID=438768 RepID=A0AAJ0F5N4_9PEZI|nr:putative leucine carboxyl methyltransferase [Echria macrotheca]